MPSVANVRAPFSIFGAPRSGTTLLARAFDLHPAFSGQSVGETANVVFGTARALEFGRGVTRPTYDGSSILTDGERLGRAVEGLMLSLHPDNDQRWLHKPIGLPKAVSEKFGDDEWDEAAEWYWTVWKECFPASRNVRLVRDPIDVVRSQRRYMQLDESSLWWSYTFLMFILFHPAAPPMSTVFYDDLICAPEKNLKRVFAAVDLPYSDKCLRAFETRHVQAEGSLDRASGLTAPPRRYVDSLNSLFAQHDRSIDWERVAPHVDHQPRVNDVGGRDVGSSRDAEIEELKMSHAGERRRLREDAARWRRFVSANARLLPLTDDQIQELLDPHGLEGLDSTPLREGSAEVAALEAELARVYDSRTWRCATPLWRLREQYWAFRSEPRSAALRLQERASLTGRRSALLLGDRLKRSLATHQPLAPSRPRKRAVISGRTTIVMPTGFSLGGVESWSVRIADSLAEQGKNVNVIVHPSRGQREDLAPPKLASTLRVPVPAIPRDTDLRFFAKLYEPTLPAVLIPNYTPGGYAVAARIMRSQPDRLRVVGFAHTDNLHYYTLLSYYADLISKFVAVSEEISENLRSLLPERADDITTLPYGVDIPAGTRAEAGPGSQPLRLVYAGRIEHEQKRVLMLLELAQRLCSLGCDFILTIAGAGPASSDLQAAWSDLAPEVQARVRVQGAVPHAEMTTIWRENDLSVIVSTYEGTSIAMLESMAHGCVPVVMRVSGAANVIDSGHNGIIVDQGDLAQMAAAITHLGQNADALSRMSDLAGERIAKNHAYDTYLEAFSELVGQVATLPERSWSDRPDVIRGTGRLVLEHRINHQLQMAEATA